jgi:hypothetical protein
MTDRPQGPGWWQASDLKWYPPEKHLEGLSRTNAEGLESRFSLHDAKIGVFLSHL